MKSTHPVSMRGFAISSNFQSTHDQAGSFKILNPWVSKHMDSCPGVVTHKNLGKKTNVQFVWVAPESMDACVLISASVIQKGSLYKFKKYVYNSINEL